MGVCYDGVEGLLYLSLFSLLAACALSVMLCAVFRLWTLMGSRSALHPEPLNAPPATLFGKVIDARASSLPPHPSPALAVHFLPAPSSHRDREYDDIDEEDPFNPQARRISYNSRRSNIHSFCSFTSSLDSQASHQPSHHQSASNVMPPPEYM